MAEAFNLPVITCAVVNLHGGIEAGSTATMGRTKTVCLWPSTHSGLDSAVLHPRNKGIKPGGILFGIVVTYCRGYTSAISQTIYWSKSNFFTLLKKSGTSRIKRYIRSSFSAQWRWLLKIENNERNFIE